MNHNILSYIIVLHVPFIALVQVEAGSVVTRVMVRELGYSCPDVSQCLIFHSMYVEVTRTQ